MGIYDRDYYRKEGPSFLDYFTSTGQVCKWLVVAYVVIYIVQLVTLKHTRIFGDFGFATSYGEFTNALAMRPDRVFQHFELWRLITGVFIHDPNNWVQVIWNLLFLWWFGREVEDLYGHREFLAVFVFAGMMGNLLGGLGALWQLPPPSPDLAQAMAAGRERLNYPIALGPTGAVTAVLILCALHYPFRTILLFFVLPVPLWVCAILRVGGDVFYFLQSAPFGVRITGNLGAAGFALLYYQFGWRFSSVWSSVVHLLRPSKAPRLREYRKEAAPPAGQTAAAADEQLEAKADAVLEKVARNGMASLSPEERDILQRASERYKKRKT